jgi:hypothetical protein
VARVVPLSRMERLGPAWLSFGVRRLHMLMKHFTFGTIAMIVVQPLAMYLFLRVLEMRFFVSAGLAALVALSVGLGFHFIQSRSKSV